MKVKAALIEIEVYVDLDEMTPDIRCAIDIEGGFEFLATNPGTLAAWCRAAANSLDARETESEERPVL